MTDRVWYFAYGSNLDPDRFGSRVGPWNELRSARLVGFRLRFCTDVQSEGGAGAVIVPHPGGHVFGAVYDISGEQMAAMDREEFDPDRDIESLGARRTITVQTDHGPVNAEVYFVKQPENFGAPSPTYLGHITKGLAAVGHGPEVIEDVEAVARAEAAGE